MKERQFNIRISESQMQFLFSLLGKVKIGFMAAEPAVYLRMAIQNAEEVKAELPPMPPMPPPPPPPAVVDPPVKEKDNA